MFDWITSLLKPGESRGGGLGSAKGLRALLGQLGGEPPDRVVRLITQRFANVDPDVPAGTDIRRPVMRLDEYAQRSLAELWGEMLSGPRGLTLSEETWRKLFNYYRSLYARYWACLRHFSQSKATSEGDQAESILVAGRAMAALARSMLLLHMRYRRPDRELWSHLMNLYQWADGQGHLSAEMELYPDTDARTTIERELLCALLAEMAPMPNLLPAQMHALDTLLRLHAASFRLAAGYDELETPFAYEPERGKPPQRWLKELPVTRGLKFFGVGAAYTALRAAKDEASSPQKMPAWLSKTRCSSEDYRELLERLVSAWSLNPPHRRHRREPCAGEILVAHDWSEIRRLVKFSELARSGRSHGYESTNIYGINSSPRKPMDRTVADPGLMQPVIPPGPLANLASFERMLSEGVVETWKLADSSEAGLGAVSNSPRSWAKVGMMIAYRYPDSVEWQLALIRRLNCSDTDRLTIGMTKMPGSVCSARLRLGAGMGNHPILGNTDPTTIEYDALVINDTEQTLLIPAGVFDRSWMYTLFWDNRRDVVKMETSLERGLNFERVQLTQVPDARAA